MDLSRRSVLASGAGVLAVGSLAGCLDSIEAGGSDDGVDSGYGAFFTLYDWSQQVAGDAADFENAVPAGDMGHGWEPEGDLVRDIAESDAFVYFDHPEFTWAQDIAGQLEGDYDHSVLIDGLESLDLLDWDDEHEDHDNDDEHDDEDHDDDHDDIETDPHAWLDPVLSKEIVDNITAGLSDADPNNAETYETNAEEYKTRLDEVDNQLQDVFTSAEGDTIVIAGHDSYAYVEERYGIEIHTPVGPSPNEEPSSNEIADTIEIVNENGIDTILYDYFESPNLANTIVDDSNATAVEAMSPVEGTTDEWEENDWGWIEQMEEINIPAFEQALGSQ